MMRIHSLETEADYDVALKEIARYFGKEPAPGSHDSDRFNLLARLISDYEDRHWPIEPPDPIGVAA
ncbi:hypothetical protein [Hypericibacter sp.]|uniref:hypothetical protein n=1 Tax=Hypericibacter sp. TaxID=2705401 RepID=UPI003D6DA7FA